FGPRSLEEAADIVAGFGFKVMDLGVCSNENAQVDPRRAAEDPVESAEYVLRVLEPWEFQLNECFVLDFGEPINHPDPMIRRSTRRLFPGLVKFAQRVGCRSIMLIPGTLHPDLGREQSFALAAQELAELSRVASDEGIFLNIEACEPSVAQGPEDAGRLCEEVPGLGLTLDYSHFIDQGYSQLEIETLHRYARHFHIRQAAPGKRVETVAKGTIDFERVVRLLREEEYGGVLSVEYVECPPTTECGVDVITETPKMKAQLESLVELDSQS
ncbi:sugar phosphate isomerase/epimerase, partial [Acidobacteria bacterium AH-259-O06]|nr:sugar phosphate isomerase/epimerase [Acidobacteria bacterium AH-259-O06]